MGSPSGGGRGGGVGSRTEEQGRCTPSNLPRGDRITVNSPDGYDKHKCEGERSQGAILFSGGLTAHFQS